MELKVGNEVEVIENHDGVRIGMKGRIESDYGGGTFAIKFNEKFSSAHDCGGVCDSKYGHFVPSSKLKLLTTNIESYDIWN